MGKSKRIKIETEELKVLTDIPTQDHGTLRGYRETKRNKKNIKYEEEVHVVRDKYLNDNHSLEKRGNRISGFLGNLMKVEGNYNQQKGLYEIVHADEVICEGRVKNSINLQEKNIQAMGIEWKVNKNIGGYKAKSVMGLYFNETFEDTKKVK